MISNSGSTVYSGGDYSVGGRGKRYDKLHEVKRNSMFYNTFALPLYTLGWAIILDPVVQRLFWGGGYSAEVGVMIVYDGYHREMLFKVICMQNKLLKH